MTQPPARLSRSVDLAAGCGPAAALAAAIEPVLTEAAAEGARTVTLLSIVLDRPGRAPECALTVEAWVERATRTLVFASAEARARDGGGLVAAASAVFSVDAPAG